MTGFKNTAGEWLDFSGPVGLEIRSPLFDTGTVPGILSYPVNFSDTPHNRRLLGFPATRSRQPGTVPALDWDYYIGGLLWRRGVLRYQGYDSKAREYTYQFEADADALASRIDGVSLPQLGLSSPAVAGPETDEYVLAPVRNNTFYSADKNPRWGKVVNYYPAAGGGPAVNTAGSPHVYSLVPMLKVVPLLTAGLAGFGYSVSGPWVEDAEIQTLVLYSTRALDQVAGPEPAATFLLADATPDVRLADLLIALQQLFCLGYVFDPVRRNVHVVPLRTAATATASIVRTPRLDFRDLPNSSDGFLHAFTPDGSDDLLKVVPWAELRLGNAKESIKPAADTLTMVREPDPHQPTRRWLVPAAEQAGQSLRTDFEQVDNRLGHLRFLFYRGLQPASDGSLYPLLTAGTVNYAYQPVGSYALAWDGAQGLYQQWHKPWLDFRAAARGEERDVALSVGEFMNLNPLAKDVVDGLRFLWERISITAGGDGTLSDATITYHQIAQ